MPNTLTIAELKRSGMAAIERVLKRGSVHIYQRNRPAALVLSMAHGRQAPAARRHALPGMTALDRLLAHPADGTLMKHQIHRRLPEECAW